MDKEDTRNLTVAEAGARGGAATYAQYGKEFYRSIGRLGQAALSRKITAEQRRVWGLKGGRPRKRCSFDPGEKR